MYLGQDIQ